MKRLTATEIVELIRLADKARNKGTSWPENNALVGFVEDLINTEREEIQ